MALVTQRRFRSFAIVILLSPALLYRAFIPAGFMPTREAGGALQFGLCPSIVDAASFIAAAANPHAHHHHGDSDTAPEHGKHFTPCPYTLSGSAPLAAALCALAPVVAADEKPLSSTVATAFLASIHRAQSPRAPPALA